MDLKKVKLIIHPSMPKCASSSIQTNLINNRLSFVKSNTFILDKNLEVRIGSTSIEDPHGIPYSTLIDAIDCGDIEERLTAACVYINRYYGLDEFTLILTSELLCSISNDKFRNLHERINALFNNILVVIVVRSPWTQLLSHWRQSHYRTGEQLETYINKAIKISNGRDYWSSIIEEFYKVYGGSSVKILSLDCSDDIWTDFIDTAGILNDEVKNYSSRSNPSLSPILCSFICDNYMLFEDEVNDKRNLLIRHKKILHDLVKGTEYFNVIFNGKINQSQLDGLILAKKHFLNYYFSMLKRYSVHKNQDLIAIKYSLAKNNVFSLSLISEDEEKEYAKKVISILIHKLRLK